MPFLWHPLVVHFPIALWLTSFLFDVLHARTADRFFATGARYLIGLGLLGAAAAAVSGFVDYRPLVAQGIGQAFVDQHGVHSLLAYGTTALYGALFVLRWRVPALTPRVSLPLATAGAALIAVTAYLGGEIRRVM